MRRLNSRFKYLLWSPCNDCTTVLCALVTALPALVEHTQKVSDTHTHRHKHTQLNKISSTPLQSLWFHQANYFAILYTARSWRWQREKFTKGLKSFIVKSRLLCQSFYRIIQKGSITVFLIRFFFIFLWIL